MRIFLIVLLVLSVLGISGAGFLLLKNQKTAPVVKVTPKTYVIVPNTDLLRGHVVAPGDLVWMEWPSGSASSFISSKEKEASLISKFNGRVSRLEISAKTPILDKNFIPKDAAGGLISLLLQPGKRAYTISVTIDTGGAGFIVPGDYVDIVLVQNLRDNLPRSSSNKPSVKLTDQIVNSAAETLLQNVKVIAVGANTYVARTSSDTVVTPVGTITVEVSQPESEKLALAKTMGSLSIVLRSLAFEPPSDSANYVADTQTSKVLEKFVTQMRNSPENDPATSYENKNFTENKKIKIYSGRSVIERNISPR